MSLAEVLFFIILFSVGYGVAVLIAFAIDTVLKKIFGRGIMPKGYWE